MDVLADGGEPMNVFRTSAPPEGIKVPLERVKFGQKRPKLYIPGEAGYSTDADKLNDVIATWTGLEDLAPARGEGGA